MYGSGNPDDAPAPPVPQVSASKAVSMPSAETPALIFAYAEGRLPAARCSSRRSSINCTGALASFARRAHAMPCTSGSELAAEPAAHVLGDHADVGLRDTEAGGEAFARAVHGLRADPRRQLLAFPLADAAVRLERHVRLHLRVVGLLDDVRGRGEAGLDVALFLGLRGLHVAALEHRRRLRPQGLLDRREERQHFVLDLDRACRVARLILGGGGHGGHFVADVHHLATGLGDGHGRLDALHRERRREVDRRDAGVRMRRPQDAAIQQAGPLDVVGVLRAPRDLQRTVDPVDPRAQDLPFLRPRVRRVRVARSPAGSPRRPGRRRSGCPWAPSVRQPRAPPFTASAASSRRT